jgi:NitT/TauT family transport system substrate-binding protein
MKRRQGRLWCGMLGVLVLILFIGALPARSQEPLRLGILPVVDTLPLLVGETEGLFEKEGLTVALVSFQSALERDAALQAGKLDGYFGDILNTILLIRAGQNLRIVTTVFHTHPDFRMFGIVTAPGAGLASPADLAGKQVAISRATIIEYLLDRLLATRGLPPDYVVKLEIKKIPIRMQMLLADQVPAALLPEPLLSLAEFKGGTVLLDDRGLDTSETILAFSEEALRRPGLAEAFLTAYGQAVRRINQAPEAYKDLLVARTRFPMPVKEQFRVPVFPEPGPPSAADVAAVQDWLAATGNATQRRPYETLVRAAQP